MWLSLFIALITYLLSPKDTSAQRKRALLNAAVAGGITYGLTEYTDWGKEVSNEFDGMIGVGNKVDDEAATNATKPASVGSPGTGTAGSSGSLWSTLTSWGAAGTAAVVGTTGAAAGAVSGNWLPVLAIGAAALLILK